MKEKIIFIGLKVLYVVIAWLITVITNGLLQKVVVKSLVKKRDIHTQKLVSKLTTYTIYLLGITVIFAILGIRPETIITSLGLFSVAIGFAAQTSLSNVISGFFILFEKPFKIGDAIDVNGTFGEVLSVDLMSITMRTFDNVLVRIPNETVLKASIKNYTRFDIRRLDITVGISYDADIEKAKTVIAQFLEKNPHVLKEPKYTIITKELADSSVNLSVLVWIDRREYFTAYDAIVSGIKEALDREGIEIPFPQVVVHMANEKND